ncbi:MAG: hypothetical protein KC416_02250 [Myxococcales bacterium]|nr:hypothetical protein [Myxococcales bacterium]
MVNAAVEDPRKEALKEARIALLDANRLDANGICRVLRSAVKHVDQVQTLAEIAGETDLVVADYESFKAAAGGNLTEAVRRLPARLLTYSNNYIREDLAALFAMRGLTNLLAKAPGVDGAELLVTTQKILQDDIFGIDKYFPWGTPTKRIVVRRSSERQAALDEAAEFASTVKVASRLLDVFLTVTDELLTNAIFNAPVDETGKARYSHLHRTAEVELTEEEAVVLDLATDGRRLGIGVADQFGSLQADKVLDYLAKCFRKGEDQVDVKEGGAGLGLYYAFEALSQFTVNIEPGKRTEVIGLIDVSGSYRDYVARAKSFNIFVKEPA